MKRYMMGMAVLGLLALVVLPTLAASKPAPAPATVKLSGTVVSCDTTTLVLKVGENEKTVTLDAKTAITVNGKKAAATSVAAGMQADVVCKEVTANGQKSLVARKLDARKPKPKNPPAPHK